MPGYAHAGAGLAAGLSYQHGFPLACAPEPPVDPASAAVGARLAGAAGGFNCIQCHAVGARPATAPFEAPGNNLAAVTTRLRRGYYDRWMLAPLRVDPATKMPRFSDEDGLTPLTDVEDGDAAAQFGAIWEYMRGLSPVKDSEDK
jgi:mono/diheme cytochrome c family protein